MQTIVICNPELTLGMSVNAFQKVFVRSTPCRTRLARCFTNAVIMQPVLTYNRPAIEERLGEAAAHLCIGTSFDIFNAYF